MKEGEIASNPVVLRKAIIMAKVSKKRKQALSRVDHSKTYSLSEASKLVKEISTTKTKIKGYDVTIIDNGKYQLAMVPVLGWDKTEVVTAKGLHPESNESTVVDVSSDFTPSKDKSRIYATLMLWKKSGEKWKKKELVPLKSLEESNGTVVIRFNNGTNKLVDFNKK